MSSVFARLVCVGLWAIFSFLGGQPAWGQIDERTKLIEAAKKEGKLLWYTSTNVTESKPLLDDFEKQNPFIKGEIFRASGEVILNRIVTETRANKWNFDVVMVGEFDVLMDAKLLAPYKSPEAKNFLPDFVNPNGYWSAAYVNYRAIGCEVLGQRENAKIHESSGEARHTMAQGTYLDRAADGGGGIPSRRHLRASHRRDEATGSTSRMGEYRQPGGGNIERSGLECEAASSECGETLYRFSSVQTCPAAAARASAHSSAL